MEDPQRWDGSGREGWEFWDLRRWSWQGVPGCIPSQGTAHSGQPAVFEEKAPGICTSTRSSLLGLLMPIICLMCPFWFISELYSFPIQHFYLHLSGITSAFLYLLPRICIFFLFTYLVLPEACLFYWSFKSPNSRAISFIPFLLPDLLTSAFIFIHSSLPLTLGWWCSFAVFMN